MKFIKRRTGSVINKTDDSRNVHIKISSKYPEFVSLTSPLRSQHTTSHNDLLLNYYFASTQLEKLE
jgi:hypothetical protein